MKPLLKGFYFVDPDIADCTDYGTSKPGVTNFVEFPGGSGSVEAEFVFDATKFTGVTSPIELVLCIEQWMSLDADVLSSISKPVRLTNKGNTGLCVTAGSDTEGSKTYLRATSSNEVTQLWRVVNHPTDSSKIKLKSLSWRSLCWKQDEVVLSSNSNVECWWTVEGSVLTNVDGKALDARNGVFEGTDFIVYQKHGGANQQWFITEDTDEMATEFAKVPDPNQGLGRRLTSRTSRQPRTSQQRRFLETTGRLLLEPALSALAMGDPHVRTSDGKWVDFYGEAGTYTLLQGQDIVANGRFGLASTEHALIWHPRVMKAGTMMEEVAIDIVGSGETVRMGVYGGGLLSLSDSMQRTSFLTRDEIRTLTLGDVTLSWFPCDKDCEVEMPWGVHTREHVLKVTGPTESLVLYVAQSSGYRFIDADTTILPAMQAPVEASSKSGLLTEAALNPTGLRDALLKGHEAQYVVQGNSLLGK
jgi:hypothetical protein